MWRFTFWDLLALFSCPTFMWASSFFFLHCPCVSPLDFIPSTLCSVLGALAVGSESPWGTDCSSLFGTDCSGPHTHYAKFTGFQLLFSHWPSEISSEFLLAILGILGMQRIPNSFLYFLWCRCCACLVAKFVHICAYYEVYEDTLSPKFVGDVDRLFAFLAACLLCMVEFKRTEKLSYHCHHLPWIRFYYVQK